jgi:hypothetical protein
MPIGGLGRAKWASFSFRELSQIFADRPDRLEAGNAREPSTL